LRSLLLLASLAAFAPAARPQSVPVCAPSPEVRSALDRIPANPPADQATYDFLQQRRSATSALMQRYPGDVFVQRAYIAAMSDAPSDRAKVIAEYRALHERRPEDGYLSYLYATTLLGHDTPQAIELFAAALAKAPSFPWPHLQFVSVYSTPNFLDKAKAVAHARAFLSACPAALEGYPSIVGLGDNDLIRQAAPQLRRILEPRTDAAALGAYTTLWPLEFAAYPPSEYDRLRKQVADDVARLRALNLETVPQWWRALEDGYQLTNDEKQSRWAADQNARRFPSNASLPDRARWYEANDYPGSDAPQSRKKPYYSDLLRQTDSWIRQRPKSYPIWFDRLQALENLDDSPNTEVESCVAKLLAIAQTNKGPEPLDAVTDYQLIFALYARKLQPQRQLELAQKALAQRETEYQQIADDRYVASKNAAAPTFWRPYWRFSARFYEADAYVRLKQPAKAEDALAQADATLRILQPQVNGNDEFRKAYARQESSYWLAEAHLAELESHGVDAMAYYQSALLARLDSGSVPAPGEKDDLAHDAHRLWAGLGGSEESWKRWYTSRADALAAQSHLTWETGEQPLPPFRLTDLQGETWQSVDLRGKVLFLNFWASY
jgi:hypothetical protein